MSSPLQRLRSLSSHLFSLPQNDPSQRPATKHIIPSPDKPHIHTLSPTSFLPRAAAIEPEAEAVYHITANGKVLRRSYQEFADRARGLAYFIKKKGWKRVGILAPNTPAFLESIFGIAASGSKYLWEL
jgi:long-subunit acyl-CoA synthetase (AMP-forming)